MVTSNKKYKTNCDYCGQECYKCKSQIQRHSKGIVRIFCSKQCRDAGRKNSAKLKEFTCGECGNVFLKNPQEFKQENTVSGHRFCNQQCANKYMGRTRRGENNPNWKNIKTAYIYRLRLKVLNMLGGPICVNCGCNVIEILEINHKHGEGSKQRRLEGYSRSNFYRDILNGKLNKDEYDIRCRVCNALHYVEDTKGISGHIVSWNKMP